MSSGSSSRRIVLLAIGTIFVLGLILRVYKADYSLFGDEFFTADLADRSVAELIEQIRGDLHPPLYFILVHYVSGVLSDEVGYRLLSIVAGTISLIGLFLIVNNEMSFFAAVSTGIMGVFSPLLISYSQEARQYALFFCIVVWATFFLLRFVRHRRSHDLLILGLLSTAGLYVHYFYALILITHGGYLLYQMRSPARRLQSFLLLVGCVVLVLPWLLYALPVQLAFKETVVRPQPSLMAFPKLFAEFTVGHTLFNVGEISAAREPLGEDLWQNLPLGVGLVVSCIGVFVIGTRRLYQQSRYLFVLLCLLLTVTPIVMALMSYSKLGSFMSAKYSIASLVPLLIILGVGLEGVWVRRSLVSVGLALVFLTLVGVSLNRYYFARDEFGRWEDWKSCGREIKELCSQGCEGTIVFQNNDRRQYSRYFEPTTGCAVTDYELIASMDLPKRERILASQAVFVPSLRTIVKGIQQGEVFVSDLERAFPYETTVSFGNRLRCKIFSRLIIN
jgi:4-amino-4-deoxy-L-arabinose transferase-like glycosyltransferase